MPSATSPGAGFYREGRDVQLVPPEGAFVAPGLSVAHLLLCRYSSAAGYDCDDTDGSIDFDDFTGATVETDPTTNDYLYTFGDTTADNEVLSLPGSAGITTVYDLKILNDSYLGDGSVSAGDATIYALPYTDGEMNITYDLDYSEHTGIGRQIFSYRLTPESFETQMAPARSPFRRASVKMAAASISTASSPAASHSATYSSVSA